MIPSSSSLPQAVCLLQHCFMVVRTGACVVSFLCTYACLYVCFSVGDTPPTHAERLLTTRLAFLAGWRRPNYSALLVDKVRYALQSYCPAGSLLFETYTIKPVIETRGLDRLLEACSSAAAHPQVVFSFPPGFCTMKFKPV